MTGHYFVSYSRIDAADDAVWLADTLVAGPPSIPVWLDKRDLRPGEAWDEQIVEAIRTCRGLLFVMTTDSVRPNSMTKPEWIRALRYKKPVIPLRFRRDAELPFRLEPREYVDFTGSVEAAMTRLRQHLEWMATPAGALQVLKERQADAERELERTTEVSERARIEQELKELRRQIAAQEHMLADPQAASQDTQQRIASGLEREREPERAIHVRRAKFINPPPLLAPTWFQDRHVETGQIGDFLENDRLRLLTVVGRGGVGKTAMVCRLLKALEGGQLPDDGGPLAVDGIVYLSPVGVHKVSYPSLFADLPRLLADDAAERLKQLYQDPKQTIRDQMLALLEAFPNGCTVVLLDNFEDVVDTAIEPFEITDAALNAALHTVLTAPQHGVKLILTTRVAPGRLLRVQPARQRRLDLDEGLGSPYAENILREMDPDGTLGLKTASAELLAAARERTGGYPRALEALVAILAADRDTSLPELLAETSSLLGDVVEELVGEAFNRLDALAQQVMQTLAIYGLPVPPVAVDFVLQPYLVAVDSAPVLGRLVNMQFVRRDAGRYYLHQVDRDYALSRIPEGEPADREATEPRFTRFGLRHRGAEYFEQTRTPRETWKQLDDLAPQLAEFELRYQGEDYDTAADVLTNFDFDYLRLWGHYRLLVDLHERLQGKLTDPNLQELSASNLGIGYDSLGETRQAINLYEQALDIARDLGDREGQAYQLNNLGDGYVYGEAWEQAIQSYNEAIRIADEISLNHIQSESRDGLANAQLSLGQMPQAREAAEAARGYDYPPKNASVSAILGTILLRQGQVEAARLAFTEAVAQANMLLERTGDNYAALDDKALALSGLAVLGDIGRLAEARGAALAARAINREVGVVHRALQRWDALAVADQNGLLVPVRDIAAGRNS
jgi:tetratricopeptide (TPR) repeat protein